MMSTIINHGFVYNSQCEQRCNSGKDGFVCKSFTVNTRTSRKPICRLHSDDTIGAGVSSLIRTPGVTYKEREPCLNRKLHIYN